VDGLIGQMMEPIVWHELPKRDLPPKDWATTGKHGRSHTNIINSLYIDPNECDRHNQHLEEKYAQIKKNEVRWKEEECEDAELVITAYGTPARIAVTAIETLRNAGIKVGLFRPITLWPYPEEALHRLAGEDHVKAFLDLEMSSSGQMLDDVRLSVEGQKPISFLGHAGGAIPTVEEIAEAARNALKEAK
jgi:2-oxoglutarate ferredoxin oxidoreductase subunit alpha